MMLDSDIETHFENAMPVEVQRRLGVDNNGSRDMSLRVLRVISLCAEQEKEISRLSEKELALAQKVNLQAEIIRSHESQRPPCSPGCYHHQTHPCEKCGRISGYSPVVFNFRIVQELKSEIERLSSEVREWKDKILWCSRVIKDMDGRIEHLKKLLLDAVESRSVEGLSESDMTPSQKIAQLKTCLLQYYDVVKSNPHLGGINADAKILLGIDE